MGERKGTNLYYPPDYDPKKGGLNKWQGTHALRERAKKIHLGILIIRFEMPYNIWCEGCGNHVGMGVRYNAEKKKVGMYYTTPVYQFRMKCHLCDNHFEIKTDPANLDYEIVSGARRQEKRFKAEDNGTVVPDDKADINKMATDAMFKLEHGDKDKDKGQASKPVIKKIYEIQDRVRDDYEANKALRAAMRVKRKAAQKQSEEDGKLLAKSSLNINLLPENESDRKTAALLRLAPAMTPEQRQSKERGSILESQSIFDKPSSASTSTPTLMSAISAPGSSASSSSRMSPKEAKVNHFKKLVAIRKRQGSDGGGGFSASSSGNFKVRRRRSDTPAAATAVSGDLNAEAATAAAATAASGNLNAEAAAFLKKEVAADLAKSGDSRKEEASVLADLESDASASSFSSAAATAAVIEPPKIVSDDAAQTVDSKSESSAVEEGESSGKKSGNGLLALVCDYGSSDSD